MIAVFYLLPLFYGLFIFLSIIFKEKTMQQVDAEKTSKSMPKVGVLVAARNEEANIATCLQSILEVNYSGDLEVWIGDDASEDQTAHIVREFQQKDSRVHLLSIGNLPAWSKGKANVLAHLANKCNAEVFLIIDADIKVNPDFVIRMVLSYQQGFHLVNGVTDIQESSMFSSLQRVDWVLAQWVMYIFHAISVPVTAIGNCMLVSKKAYEQTGGYQKIPFSLTEDLALFQAVRKAGFSFQHIFEAQVTNLSLPQNNLNDLMKQRLRWMKGGLGLHVIPLLFLSLNLMYYPAILALSFFFPLDALGIFLIKYLLQTTGAYIAFLRLGKKPPYKALLFHEFYAGLHSLYLIFWFVIPRKVQWKGRTYP